MRFRRFIHSCLIAGTLSLTACSSLTGKPSNDAQTLADLLPAVRFDLNGQDEVVASPISSSTSAIESKETVHNDDVQDKATVAAAAQNQKLTEKQALQHYKALLEVSDDPQLIAKVRYRIADLEMIINEKKQTDIETDENGVLMDGVYAQSIQQYRDLLQQYPERVGNDAMYYQLAKAYDLDARQQESFEVLNELVSRYPNSPYAAEAHFRRAEILFSRRDYVQAQSAYQQVISIGEDTDFYRNANYMVGWSLFKRNHYDPALDHFTRVLDFSERKAGDLQNLSGGEASLVDDTFRIMTLVFSYLDSRDAIADLYQRLGPRSYEAMLYERLANLLETQERYSDMARTYQQFIDHYPLSMSAPRFHVRMIEALQRAGQTQRLQPEKERFVKLYGINSVFWKQADLDTRVFVEENLYDYLVLLTRYYHSAAQQGHGKKDLQWIRQHYYSAVEWYQEFIDTFHGDVLMTEMVFMKGESLFELGDYSSAIKNYEYAAYQASGFVRAADAGYAMILAAQKLRQQELLARADSDNDTAEKISWRQRTIEYQLRFASAFAADQRAPAAQVRAAENLYEWSRYKEAVNAAEMVKDWKSPVENNILITAGLIRGHSHYELKHFMHAETAYHDALALMTDRHPQFKATRERIAATVYKRGEQLQSKGEKLAAVEQFLRIAGLIPESGIRINSDYDAATLLMELKDWPQAITVLEGFRKQNPQHVLTNNIPAKLAMAYQESGQWRKAADALRYLAESADNPQARSEALYLAAELYEKASDISTAIDAYRQYAHSYPQPFDIAMEARFKLSEFYRQSRQFSKRLFWLKKIIEADSSAGNQRTDRSRYLAAMASSELAADARWVFNKIKLKQPLKRSLKKKKQALETALAAYQRTADYGVEEFATQALFQMGEIYRRLSEDLLDSDRPDGLSELELEQYEILLEEQAYPFEEKAIEIQAANSQRSWNGVYDQWVKRSFTALEKLLPARYAKTESRESISAAIY